MKQTFIVSAMIKNILVGAVDAIMVLLTTIVVWTHIVVTGYYLDAIFQLIVFEVYIQSRRSLSER
jgi:hypothetical protein